MALRERNVKLFWCWMLQRRSSKEESNIEETYFPTVVVVVVNLGVAACQLQKHVAF